MTDDPLSWGAAGANEPQSIKSDDPLNWGGGTPSTPVNPVVPPSGFVSRAIVDPAISLLKGAVALPEGFIGLADIPTMGYAGKAAEALGIETGETQKILSGWQSPELQAAQQKVAEAKGFLPTVGAMLQNPSTIVASGLESAPSMLGAAGISRGAMKLGARELLPTIAKEGGLERTAAWLAAKTGIPVTAANLAAGIGEGAISAGQALEQGRQATPGGTLTPQQIAIGAASGALTGTISGGMAGVGQKFGVADINTMLTTGKLGTGAAADAKHNLLTRIVTGGISEGVLQELPQSAQEQVAQNLISGKPWNEGVAQAAASGMLVGAAMGAGGNVLEGEPEAPVKKTETPESKAAAETAARVAAARALVGTAGETPLPPSELAAIYTTEEEKKVAALNAAAEAEKVAEAAKKAADDLKRKAGVETPLGATPEEVNKVFAEAKASAISEEIKTEAKKEAGTAVETKPPVAAVSESPAPHAAPPATPVPATAAPVEPPLSPIDQEIANLEAIKESGAMNAKMRVRLNKLKKQAAAATPAPAVVENQAAVPPVQTEPSRPQPAPEATPEWRRHENTNPQGLVEGFRDIAQTGEVAGKRTKATDVGVTGEAHMEQQLEKAHNLRAEGKADQANEIISKLRNKFSVNQLQKAVKGLGQKRAGIYTDISDMTRDEARDAVKQDMKADASLTGQSRKLVVLLSPDKTHVILGNVSESVREWKKTILVSTYNVPGVKTRKAPKGLHYATSYDAMVDAGWKPVATLKSNQPMRGMFQTYSTDSWNNIVKPGLNDVAVSAAGKTMEMFDSIESSREFGAQDQVSGMTTRGDVAGNEGVEFSEMAAEGYTPSTHGLTDATGNMAQLAPSSTVIADAAIEPQLLQEEQLEADAEAQRRHTEWKSGELGDLWNTLNEFKPETQSEVIDLIGEGGHGKLCIALIKELKIDTKNAKMAATELSKYIYEKYKQSGNTEAFKQSILQETLEKTQSEGVPRANQVPQPGATSGEGKQGAGRAEPRAETPAKTEAAAPAKPAPASSKPTAAVDTGGVKIRHSAAQNTVENASKKAKRDEGKTAETMASRVAQAIEASVMKLFPAGKDADGLPRRLEIRRKQSAALKKFAEDNGLIIDFNDFNQRWIDKGEKTGAEHEVYPDSLSTPRKWTKMTPAAGPGRVIDYTDKGGLIQQTVMTSGMMNTWSDYFTRIALHNIIFPTAKVRFLGFAEHDAGRRLDSHGTVINGPSPILYAVIEQDHIENKKDSNGKAFKLSKKEFKDAVAKDMASRGYMSVIKPGNEHYYDRHDYYSPTEGIYIQDLHHENVLVNEVGDLVYIDPIISLARPIDFEKGRTLSHFTKPVRFQTAAEILSDREKLKTRNLSDEQQLHNLRPSDAHTERTARQVEMTLAAMGIKVQRIIDVLSKHFARGEYNEKMNGKTVERCIKWAMADLSNPTTANFVALLHEVAHAVFERETPAVQAAIARAIKGMESSILGIGEFKEIVDKSVAAKDVEKVEQSGRLAQSLGIRLANEGFDPEKANGIADKLMRMLKDMYYGTLMGVQRVMNKGGISQELAVSYFENRLRMVLHGDTMSWINFLGGPKMGTEQWQDKAKITTRHSGIMPVTNPRNSIEVAEEAHLAVASLNEVNAMLQLHIADFKAAGLNINGLTDQEIAERFFRLPTEVDGTDLFKNGVTPQSLIETAVKQFGVNPAIKISDLPNETARQRAAVMAHRMYSDWKAVNEARAHSEVSDMRSGINTIEHNNDSITRLLKDYVNMDVVFANARRALSNMVDKARKIAGSTEAIARKAGVLEQIAREAEGTIEGDMPIEFQAVLDRISEIITHHEDGSDRTFADTLQAVAKIQGINWIETEGRPANTTREIVDELLQRFRQTGDPLLKDLFRSDTAGRALLYGTIAYGKSNAHAMALLQQRGDKASTKAAAFNEMLKDIIQANNDELDQMKATIDKAFGKDTKEATRMLIIARQIAKLKREQKSLLKGVNNSKDFVDFYNKVFKPTVDSSMAQMEKIGGISFRSFDVADGEKVPVPDAEGNITMKTLRLKTDFGKKGESPTMNSEQETWMKAMGAYLLNDANKDQGAKYNEIAEAFTKMRDFFVQDGHRKLKVGTIQRLLQPIQEYCSNTGTPIGRLLSSRFAKYAMNLRGIVKMVTQHGVQFSSDLLMARKACGYPAASEETFWNQFIGGALHHLEQLGGDIWMTAKTDVEMQDRAIAKALEYLQGQRNLDEKAKRAIDKLLRAHIFNSKLLVENGVKLGNKILETRKTATGKEQHVYRPVIGTAPFVLPRLVSDMAVSFNRDHMAAWKPASKSMMEKTAKDAATIYNTNGPDALRESLTERFTSQVWERFVRSLAYNDRPTFYAPTQGGIKELANRQQIIDAYSTSKDPVTFAENLAALNNVKADGAYVADILDSMQSMYNLLSSMCGEEAEAIRMGSPMPPRYIADARKYQAAPREWLEYAMTNSFTMERIVNGQAYHSAFGRNGSAARENFATAKSEQEVLIQKMDGWRQQLTDETPGLKEKEIIAGIKQLCENEGVDFDAMMESRKNMSALKKAEEHFAAIGGMNNSGKLPDLQPWLRLLRTISGWAVSGAGTAISATSNFVEQPARFFGFTPRALAMTGQMVADTAKVMANSMLQAVGSSIMFEADRSLAAQNAGLMDTLNSNIQRAVVAWNHAQIAYKDANFAGRQAGRLADIGSAALQTDIGLPGWKEKALARQAAGQASAPTIRALSPFSWLAECVNVGNFITWHRHMERMAAEGAIHFDNNPADLNNPDFKFDRKQVGGFNAGDREFKFLKTKMEEFGFSLEQIAREAYSNKGKDKPILSDNVSKMVMKMMLDEVMLESSITARMPLLQFGIGTAMNPFLGWPIQKTHQVLKGLREPNGERTNRALATGLLAYTAILPLAMCIAFIRNKFDEEVIGKKANVSDLSNIHDFKSGVEISLNNASRIGSLGMAGDFLDLIHNTDSARPVTLDSRIFFASTIQNILNVGIKLYHSSGKQLMAGDFQGAKETATDYQTVIRPLFSALGGSGALQNIEIMNRVLGLDNAESRQSNRLSVNSYLRVAGKEAGLQVKTFMGTMASTSAPDAVKPFVNRMLVAAESNDHEAFNKAYNDAVRAAKLHKKVDDKWSGQERTMNQEEAVKKVQSMYSQLNPLKVCYNGQLTEAEYRTMLRILPDSGKEVVQQALRMYDHYGRQIGANTSSFQKEQYPTNLLSSILKPKVKQLNIQQMMRQAASNY